MPDLVLVQPRDDFYFKDEGYAHDTVTRTPRPTPVAFMTGVVIDLAGIVLERTG